MKLEQSHIDHIRIAFQQMQSKEDLLHVLNEVKPLIYGDKAVPFELKQLTWYANPKLGKKRYTEFKIKKKSGAERSIHAPVKGLKSLQKTLSFVLQCVYEPHNAAMGFVRDRSIVDNAKLHVGSKYVYNIDLKDFFPSVDQARVWKCLQLKPFNPNNIKNESTQQEVEVVDGFILPMLSYNASNGKILKYHFYKKNYKTGLHKIALDNGNQLVYRVNSTCQYKHSIDYRVFKKQIFGKVNIEDSNDIGEIVVYKNISDIDYFYELAATKKIALIKINANNTDTDINLLIDILIKNAIEINQLTAISTGSSNTIANIIASLCCTEMEVERKNETGEWEKVKRNVLPQGAPTSPVITNIICKKLDKRLAGVAKRFGLKYSRYADDITFSSQHNIYQADSEFIDELRRIITQQGFHIKESKTRLQKDGYRKEVTGLLVNEKVNVQQRYIKQLRMWLYYWETYGYERAYGFFLQQYLADKGNRVKGKPDMANVIAGKLDYLKMVKDADNELYVKLKSRFDVLTGRSKLQAEAKIECIVESKWNDNDNAAKEILAALEAEKEEGDYDLIITGLKKQHRFKREGIKFDGTNDKEFVEIRTAMFMIMSYPTFYDYVDKILNKMDEDLALPDANNEEIIARYDKILKNLKEGIIAEFLQEKNEPIDSTKLKLFNWNKSAVTAQIKIEEKSMPILHKPKELVSLLKKFSVNDSALKYTTHSWDAGRDKGIFKDLDDFLHKAKQEYSVFSFLLHGLSRNLNAKIYNFLFETEISHKGWGEKRIKFGWSSPELLLACKNNSDLIPEDFIIPEEYQMQVAGQTIQKFKQIIDIFKNEIEIRDEKSVLENLIHRKHEKYLISFSRPKLINLENKSFYTDIQWLGKALDLIFEGIQKYPQHPVVEYAVTENNNNRLVLTILHRNSFKNGLSIYDDKLNLKRGDFSTIKDTLQNLCDWSIESEFSEGAYRINYLVSDNENPAYEKIMSAEGFKHVLTFYK